jgi:hypothetical protein
VQPTAAALAATVTQGPAGATAWKIDGSAVTQPVLNNGNVFYTGTTTPLTATSTYTGTTRDTGVATGVQFGYAYFNAFFFADQIGTAFIEGSNDNSTWYTVATSALSISTPLQLTTPVIFRYHRTKFVNGATNQGTFVVNASYTAS